MHHVFWRHHPPDESFLLNVRALCSTAYATMPLTNVSQLNLYQIHLFWRHHPIKFFFSMCGNSFIYVLLPLTNSSQKFSLYHIHLFWRHPPKKIYTWNSSQNFNLNQINLFWLHHCHTMKIFFLLCGNRYMSILRRITNASPLPNSCVLSSPPDENFLLNVWYSVLISMLQGRSQKYPNWISTKFVCSDVTTQWKFSSQCVTIGSSISQYVAAHKFIPKIESLPN